MVILDGGALVFEVWGLWLAWRGFNRTWSAHRDEPYRAEVLPIGRWTAPARMKVETIVRRLIRRPKHATVHAVAASAGAVAWGGHATGRTSFAPLPSMADEPEAFAAEVERRLQDVLERSQDVRDGLAAETRSREKADTDLRTDLDARTEEIEQLSKSIAVEGLIMQGRGWVLVFVGVALGGIGNVVQALG